MRQKLFKVGQEVRSTKLALANGVFHREQFGTVTFIPKNPLSLKVVRKNLKTAEYYHVDFWEPLP